MSSISCGADEQMLFFTLRRRVGIPTAQQADNSLCIAT